VGRPSCPPAGETPAPLEQFHPGRAARQSSVKLTLAIQVAMIMPILLADPDRTDFSEIEDEAAPRIAPIHPGEILRLDWLGPMGITPCRAATDMGVPPNRLTAILSGNRGITADTALRLARYFGTDAQSWINLQAQYDLEIAALDHGAEIARVVKPRSAA